jgi:hypothetical protein
VLFIYGRTPVQARVRAIWSRIVVRVRVSLCPYFLFRYFPKLVTYLKSTPYKKGRQWTVWFAPCVDVGGPLTGTWDDQCVNRRRRGGVVT